MEPQKILLSGKWHELKGRMRQRWGKLTADDVERIGGKAEELSGILQQRYGYGRAQAQNEINDWLHQVEENQRARS